MEVVKILFWGVLLFTFFLAGALANDLIKEPKIVEKTIFVPQKTELKTELKETPQITNSKIEQSEEKDFEREKPSPGDWISEDQVHVYDDKIVIDLKDAMWAKFTDTNSMDPVFDQGANALQIIPKSQDQIKVGDIISYEHPYSDGTIIHRVIQTGYDSKGWYAIAKGDNNKEEDPGKIRFEQIKKILVGILY